eukprot:CAMPEP_0181381106 /NCGR_PEP_ID=MMETSP1106-20121128/19932_1 /TAXON_ID=81844 /ORGANISM="Mantoniella antarctica, Strain SL-175" /LENGTH=71 /DNA_ID=CAMNT_0023500243 /DNA_START=10 /DNA_END=225 /DNA_ORIENTATION=+
MGFGFGNSGTSPSPPGLSPPTTFSDRQMGSSPTFSDRPLGSGAGGSKGIINPAVALGRARGTPPRAPKRAH